MVLTIRMCMLHHGDGVHLNLICPEKLDINIQGRHEKVHRAGEIVGC